MSVAESRRAGAKLRYEHLLIERQSAITSLAVSRGPNSRKQRDLDAELEEARQQFDATQRELGNRAPNFLIESRIVLWASSLIIFLCEAMFNRVVVEMAAPVPGWFAFSIAALVSAMLMAFAHLAGTLLRQMWSELTRSLDLMNLFIGLLLIAVDVLVVLAIVSLRTYFTTIDVSATVNIFETASVVIGLGPELLGKALQNPEALTLGGINALALFLSFIFGIISHDSEREYHKRYHTLKGIARRVKRSVDRYEREQERRVGKFVLALSRAIRAYTSNGGAIADLPRDDVKAQRAEAESASGGASNVRALAISGKVAAAR